MKANIWDIIGGLITGTMRVLGVGSILLGLVVAAIVIWSVRTLIRRFREADEVHRSWPRTDATILDVALSPLLPGERSAPVADYAYVDATGTERTGRDDGRALSRPAVGTRIRIAYDPENPEISHPLKGIRSRIFSWAAIFTVVILLLAACSALLIMLGVGQLLPD